MKCETCKGQKEVDRWVERVGMDCPVACTDCEGYGVVCDECFEPGLDPLCPSCRADASYDAAQDAKYDAWKDSQP